MEENVVRYNKRFKIDRENSNLQKPRENTNLQKPSTKKKCFNLQQSELVIDVETPVDPNIVTRRNIRNDVVDFDVETVIGSSRLEMLSLKEKIQKFGGRKDTKENEHPVNLQVSKILKPFNSVTTFF